MKLGLAIHDVADAEQRLADALLRLGERHRADHDVYHLTRQLARWSQGHRAALARFGERYGADVPTDEVGEQRRGPLSAIREKGAELAGRRPEGGLLLLRDVRELHLLAAETSVNWTILGQGAQAARDQDLLECVSLCHPETLRTMRWALTKLKESAPKVLTT
jgi:hypothetical protein